MIRPRTTTEGGRKHNCAKKRRGAKNYYGCIVIGCNPFNGSLSDHFQETHQLERDQSQSVVAHYYPPGAHGERWKNKALPAGFTEKVRPKVEAARLAGIGLRKPTTFKASSIIWPPNFVLLMQVFLRYAEKAILPVPETEPTKAASDSAEDFLLFFGKVGAFEGPLPQYALPEHWRRFNNGSIPTDAALEFYANHEDFFAWDPQQSYTISDVEELWIDFMAHNKLNNEEKHSATHLLRTHLLLLQNYRMADTTPFGISVPQHPPSDWPPVLLRLGLLALQLAPSPPGFVITEATRVYVDDFVAFFGPKVPYENVRATRFWKGQIDQFGHAPKSPPTNESVFALWHQYLKTMGLDTIEAAFHLRLRMREILIADEDDEAIAKKFSVPHSKKRAADEVILSAAVPPPPAKKARI
jgi:hypothetical protein